MNRDITEGSRDALEAALQRYREDPELRALFELEYVGPYRILDLLGEGGMGIVYLAEQRGPFRRRVALKLVKLGMDTREVLARFECERQALALMQHPNIAAIHDAGVSEQGRSYFVLEYVDGPPITEYCDRARLEPPQRVELFLQVCEAIQHAHQKGVIHRDIKPSNVLVATSAGRPLPKVIDFGVAKATHHQLTDHTLHTQIGRWIGTPGYMSPEQLGENNVDTRTDVYSLGAVLYELLVGAPPVDSGDLTANDYAGLRRRILEREPPRPTARLTALGAREAEIAAARGCDPRRLRRFLRGELEWILMKALATDPSRRYASASELAADLRRSLRGEAVLAGPPSVAYQLKAFVRRHRSAVTTSFAVMVALVAGLVATLFQYSEVRRSQAEVERQFQQIVDLTLPSAVDRLLQQADELWPLDPDLAPALRAWLDDAEELVRELPKQERQLAALLQLASARPAGVARAPNPGLDVTEAKLKLFRAARDDASGPRAEHLDDQIRILIDQAEALRRMPAVSTPALQFVVPGDQWVYETVARSVKELRILVTHSNSEILPPIEHIRWRLAESQRIAQYLPDDSRWDAALSDLGTLGIYPMKRLPRQRGLVPLGRDPVSGLHEFWYAFGGGEYPATDDSYPSASCSRFHVTDDMGVILVLIPGGTIRLGAVPAARPGREPENVDPEARPDELPTGDDIVLEPYFLAKYEVTQGQWRRWLSYWSGPTPCRRNPSWFNDDYQSHVDPDANIRPRQHPIDQVRFNPDGWLLARMGLTLPTEARWEHAARGAGIARSGARPGWWAGLPRAHIAGDLGIDAGFVGMTAPVGRYPPDVLSLHDMLGNVSEWCRDGYAESYAHGVVHGPDGFRELAAPRSYVARGGNFDADASFARPTSRRMSGSSSVPVGLRAARDVVGAAPTDR